MTGGGRWRALRRAASQLRVSFFVGVALVPTLLTQLFEGIGHWLPWWGWTVVLTAAVAALFGAATVAEQRRQQRLRPQPGQVRAVPDLGRITDLVLTVDLTKDGRQNLHTLLEMLPQVRRVDAVAGRSAAAPVPGDEQAWQRRLDQLVADATDRPVDAAILHTLPAFDVEPASLAQLRRKLDGLREALGEQRLLVVDVTGGTVPMSLATYRAAEAARLAVTYTSVTPAGRTGAPASRAFEGLIALNDPDGVLTGTPTPKEG